ncbi:MAG: hypothetical protein U0W24_19680 [Bacteroidales bacterium]
MVLIKFLLYSFAVYFVIKSVTRMIFPFLYANPQQKFSDKDRGRNKQKREGEITIEHKGTGKKGYDKNIGEYVEYEEVKD